VLLAWSVPLLLVLSWLAIDVSRQSSHREALRRDGKETIGRIEKVTLARGSQMWVKYDFAVDSTLIRNEVRVPDSFHKAVNHEDSLRIRYLPTDPGINHPAEWEWTISSESGWLVVLAWAFLVPFVTTVDLLRKHRLSKVTAGPDPL
jgi:hypothetical protein